MKKVLLIALFGAVCGATPSFAADQDVVALQAAPATQVPRPPAAPAPARPPAAPPPARPPAAPGSVAPAEAPAPPNPQQLARLMANVRFDVTITDTGGPKPATKTVSLTVSPGSNGSIRSSAKAEVPSPANNMNVGSPVSWLNVDVRSVNAFDTNSVRAAISVEYQAYIADAKVQPGAVIASSTSTFTDGRRTQVLVTSDPVSDRKTTIEVTATVVK